MHVRKYDTFQLMLRLLELSLVKFESYWLYQDDTLDNNFSSWKFEKRMSNQLRIHIQVVVPTLWILMYYMDVT